MPFLLVWFSVPLSQPLNLSMWFINDIKSNKESGCQAVRHILLTHQAELRCRNSLSLSDYYIFTYTPLFYCFISLYSLSNGIFLWMPSIFLINWLFDTRCKIHWLQSSSEYVTCFLLYVWKSNIFAFSLVDLTLLFYLIACGREIAGSRL